MAPSQVTFKPRKASALRFSNQSFTFSPFLVPACQIWQAIPRMPGATAIRAGFLRLCANE